MNKTKLYGREYSRTQLKNNIMKVYDVSGRGKNWYKKAHAFAAGLSKDITLEQSAGIIAALSPQKSWSTNQKLAKSFILDGKRSGHTGVFILKCERILMTEQVEEIATILNGNKITSFFYNILYPENFGPVTIDRHAIGIAVNGPKRRVLGNLSLTDNQYRGIEQAYILAAEQLGIFPHELQAITWVKYRSIQAKGLNVN